MAYVDGFVIPVPADRKEDYRQLAAAAAPVFTEHGALRVVECWSDSVPHGETTDFWRAVKAQEGEEVVFSWVVWPSKAVRDDAMPKVMEDPRMRPANGFPFDGRRLIAGGFDVLLDHGSP